MLAAKVCDDEYYNNAYYARLGGISCDEMNQLELEFIQLVSLLAFCVFLSLTPTISDTYRSTSRYLSPQIRFLPMWMTFSQRRTFRSSQWSPLKITRGVQIVSKTRRPRPSDDTRRASAVAVKSTPPSETVCVWI
jgi:hypothetical protein